MTDTFLQTNLFSIYNFQFICHEELTAAPVKAILYLSVQRQGARLFGVEVSLLCYKSTGAAKFNTNHCDLHCFLLL